MIADLRRRSGVDEGCFVALIRRSHGFTSGPAWFSALACASTSLRRKSLTACAEACSRFARSRSILRRRAWIAIVAPKPRYYTVRGSSVERLVSIEFATHTPFFEGVRTVADRSPALVAIPSRPDRFDTSDDSRQWLQMSAGL